MEKIAIIIPRRGVNDEGKGKKFALNKLISQASTELVWLRDDDAVFHEYKAEDYVEVPDLLLPDADLIILPLTMTEGNGTLIERLQQIEYLAIQSLTLLTAQHGHAVMCSGANMIVRRNRWLESYKDLHLEIPSGDDMFLLESFKHRGLKIMTLYYDSFIASVQPQPNLHALLRQRMRWAGKAPKYKDKDIICCGILTLLANLLVWIPPIFLLKIPLDCYLVSRAIRKYYLQPTSFFSFRRLVEIFLLELLYPIYMLISIIGGLIHPQRW